MKTHRMYVDVDTQIDFCDPKGALFVRGAPAIMDNVRALIGAAVKSGSLLVGSVDSHDFTAWEFAKNGGPFPPHCMKGTAGWLKVEGTLAENAVFVPNTSSGFETKKGASQVLFEKEVYSLFVNPQAESVVDVLLAERGLKRGDVTAIVFGVATDYCVKAAALGLKERGFEVVVASDAIAAVSEEGGRAAIDEMRAAGVEFESTAALTRAA